MKSLKLSSVIFLTIVLFIGCNGKRSDGKGSKNDSVISTVFSVDSLLISADKLVNKTITVEGKCSHLCVHSGKKLFLEGSSESSVIRAKSEKAFRQECINKQVKLTGKLIEERIDEAYLVEWENELANDSTASREGCKTEKKTVSQESINSVSERIADFRARISEEKEKSGKDYLSFYHIETSHYQVEH